MNYSMIDLPDVELLSREETRYNIKLAQEGDKNALDKLVKHNLKLVLKVTYRFKNSGYDLQDLFQIGVIGLIKAVKGFDLSRDIRFSTYAVSRIIGEIRLHLRDDGLIKVSRSLKKIAREVKQKEEEMKKNLNRSPSIGELAKETGYTKSEIIQAMEASKSPTSIYQTIHEDDGNNLFLVDSLEENTAESGISNLDKLELVEVLKKLDERSRLLIFLRYFEDKTQQEIADYLGISQVQVSRLEKKILAELRQSL
ncbi:MAG: polymerase sporulation-specific sigma factor [Halanaerobiales bacterium]|nr:polymerase sporulation-specific sigma factor [Halanaerobiales bacterium]